MKKFSLLLFSLFFIALSYTAFCQEIYDLPNGLHIVITEEPSFTLEELNVEVKAGYNKQTPETSGLSSLYAQLFPYIKGAATNWDATMQLESVCDKASVFFKAEFTAYFLQEALSEFAIRLKTPDYSNKAFQERLSFCKAQIKEYNAGLQALINSAVDARVNYPAPWLFATGANYSMLETKTNQALQAMLKAFALSFYVPNNTTFYFTGPIATDDIMYFMQKYFDSWQYAPLPLVNNDTQDFVSYDDLFNRYYVVHDKSFTPDFCHVVCLFKIKSDNFSQKDLALLQTAFDPESVGINIITSGKSDFLRLQFLAFDDIKNIFTNIDMFLTQVNSVSPQNSEPFVFVFANTKEYKKQKQAFENARYKVVTKANAAWQNMSEYKELLKKSQELNKAKSRDYSSKDIFIKTADYAIKNHLENTQYFTLQNGIKTTLVSVKDSGKSSLVIKIKGGYTADEDCLGLEDCALECLKYMMLFNLNVKADITVSTNIFFSYLVATFDTKDTDAVIKTIYSVLCTEDVPGSLCDNVISQKKSDAARYLLEAKNQLETKALLTIFKEEPTFNIYKKTAILQGVNYQKMLKAFTTLLDSNRYELCVVSVVDFDIKSLLEETFGTMASFNLFRDKSTKIYKADFSLSPIKVPVNHVFLDTKPSIKQKPLKLNATVAFEDPVVFFAKIAPESCYIEEALLQEIAKRIKEKTSTDTEVNIEIKPYNIATLTISKVKTQKEALALYDNAIASIKKDINSTTSYDTLYNIKALWVKNSFTLCQMPQVKALLLAQKPQIYNQYKALLSCSQKDFSRILSDYLYKEKVFVAFSESTK